MNKQHWFVGLAATAFLAGIPVHAQEAGDWIVRAGVYTVAPKSDNSEVADVDSGTTLGFSGTYMFTDRFGLDVLASLPFSHDIELATDGSKVGETKHLPPTITAQYYFPVSEKARIYTGLGLNWTIFFDEETTGALAGTELDLDDSVGLALQVGVDVDISDRMFANLDVRYIDIETDATLDNADLTTVEIDPWVIGLNLGWRF